jgi:hypothetical protein
MNLNIYEDLLYNKQLFTIVVMISSIIKMKYFDKQMPEQLKINNNLNGFKYIIYLFTQIISKFSIRKIKNYIKTITIQLFLTINLKNY